MDAAKQFQDEVRGNIAALAGDGAMKERTDAWMRHSVSRRYSYNFSWMGRPIIQYPQDMVAIQELIWKTKPDLIVETGIAHGGSLIYSASMLELLGGNGRVLGIDVDIRPHNRKAIESHPLARRIDMLEGSSIDPDLVERVYAKAAKCERPMIFLDSNHTHDHVLEELRMYSPLVRAGSYLVVFDTLVEDMPEGTYPDRPWTKGNNPKTAVRTFLAENRRFVVDREIEAKLQITAAPEGYLKCVSDR